MVIWGSDGLTAIMPNRLNSRIVAMPYREKHQIMLNSGAHQDDIANMYHITVSEPLSHGKTTKLGSDNDSTEDGCVIRWK